MVMGAIATGTLVMTDGAKNKTQQSFASLSKEVRSLRKRVDELDSSYRKLFRGMLIVTSVTTGIDIATWV